MTSLNLSQIAVETLERGTPRLRLSQIAIESLERGAPALRLSQIAIEVLRSSAGTAVAVNPFFWIVT